jgi:D-alanine-D-alanine ligase
VLSTAQRRRPSKNRLPADDDRALKVVVLMGGVGPEREVSLVSGSEVADALLTLGHTVESWVLDSDQDGALDALPRDADVVFIALHGEYGEDGRVQRALTERGFAYTGSGPQASAIAFDKQRSKRVMAHAGIPLAADRLLPYPFNERDLRHAVRMSGPGTWVVKPVRMGSSVGVTICKSPGQLTRALTENARWKQPQLIEKFVPGHELTCGILGGEPLPLVEPVPLTGHYDYRAKYESGAGTTYRVEPETIPADVRARAKDVARRAHEALGCAEFSRVDLRYDPAKGQLVVLEVNTIPGLTPTSLLPKGAKAIGLDFPHLCDRLCRLALRVSA